MPDQGGTFGWNGASQRGFDFPAGVLNDFEVGVSPSGRARLRYNDVTKELELSVDGGSFSALATDSESPWFVSGDVIQQDDITDSVAIGSSSLSGSEKLRVVGETIIEGDTITLAAPASTEVEIGVVGEGKRMRFLNAWDGGVAAGATIGLVNIPNGDATPNQVFSLGHNRSGVGGKEIASELSWHMGLERSFNPGPNVQPEYYIQYVSADNSLTLRPVSAIVNLTTGVSTVGLQGEISWASAAQPSTQLGAGSDTGFLSLIGSGAGLLIDPGATGNAPFAGDIRLAGTNLITAGNGSNSGNVLQYTGSGNTIVGGLSNAGSVFLDGGPGQGAVIRVNGSGAFAVQFSSTAATYSMPIRLPQYTVATAPGANAGSIAYFSDGDAGSPCLGVYDGTSWKRVVLGATISP